MFEALKKLISENFDIEADIITPDAILSHDLGLDHIDMLDLVMDIEDHFELEICDEDFKEFETVADIVKYVEKNYIKYAIKNLHEY